MAKLCSKCGTLYHTEEEWALNNSGRCEAHSLEDSPTLEEARRQAKIDAARILKRRIDKREEG
jgi:hypothetical protein